MGGLGDCPFFFITSIAGVRKLETQEGFTSPSIFPWLGFCDRMKIYISQGVFMPFDFDE